LPQEPIKHLDVARLGEGNVRLDLQIPFPTGARALRIIVGDADFCDNQAKRGRIEIVREQQEYRLRVGAGSNIHPTPDGPGVVYLPSTRQLEIPETTLKAPGKLRAPRDFIYRVRPPTEWRDSIESLLYANRWEDLNAHVEGRADETHHFEAYAKAFNAFFEGTKSLVWERGELFVKVHDTGRLHPLTELSSGEQQVLLIGAELLYRWKPGSLILIDEPELHLHSSFQTTLWSMLTQWQKERGGQVIVATQSNELFGLAEPGTTVLLRGNLA
jgi:hypothetical protein